MVRNVIFDLCGPIITIDVNRISQRLRALGATSENPYLDLYHEGLTKRFESNQIEPSEFFQSLRDQLSIEASDEAITDAWNCLIVGFDLRHADFIRQLHRSRRTFLLSNSDVINARYFHDFLNAQAGYPFLEESFDDYYFSYRVGLRKPSPEIFRHIVEEHGLDPAETLVVDDCLKHCQGALEAGLQAHFLQPTEDITQLTSLFD